ncbi:hypothetical protein Tco_0280663 [Tanacetum coccineum]
MTIAISIENRSLFKGENEQAQQAARDEKLVPSDDRVKIGSSNFRIDPTLTQKEETYQVILDIIKSSSCYKAFLITANVLEIYMQQFWFTILKEFTVPPSNDSLIDFLMELGYKGQLKQLSDMFIDHMHQPWRFLSRKMSSNDRLRSSRIFNTKLTTGNQRQGTLYNTSEDDGVLRRLKFITKGEEYQKGIGKRAQGTKATIIPKKATVASKKKNPKKKELSSDESDVEPAHRPTGRRKPRGVTIRYTLRVSKKKSIDQSQNLKAIELLSDAAQLEINTQKEIKASKHESRFQHQSSSSSEGVDVSDEEKDKSKAKDDLDNWGSTDDETLFFDDKDEQVKEILKESDNDDHEMTDVVKTDASTLVKDNADKEHKDNANKEHEDNAKRVEEQRVDEEQKGDDQAENEQIGVPISVTNKEKPDLLQYTSSHSISSNFGNQFLNNSPNVSLIAPQLPAIKVPATPTQANQVPKSKALIDVLQIVSDLEKDVKKLKQVYHSPAIHESIKSLKDVSEIIKVKQEHAAKEKMPKYLTTPFDQAADDEYVKKDIMFKMMMESKSYEKHLAHKALYEALIQSLLVDENDVITDKDQDLPVGSDQGMKKRRSGKDVEPSMKSLKSKESAKGKTPSNTYKIGKSVSANKSIHEPAHVVLLDDEELNLDHVANDVDEPQVDAQIPNQD